ncbi:hypothetical protein Shell_0432 [Staphylothermus hellenicus DSM 12710]|uniref:Iron-sulfur cluster loop n=1 Tax=Staphylothermus hellenicus (strain DSM 12710 / JCM 10830 / BK20S6-10-b1 / P8) TaxID=591019 RepID=D7DBL6_STAHD|nr:hypothetical protein Shell_0432 [Staphylothermus hellenicus DSM 12710]
MIVDLVLEVHLLLEVIGVDTRIAERMARILSKMKDRLETLNLFDERFYPSRRDDRENVLRYFIVMVAMDHRLSRFGKPYEACLPNDDCYHGADLLYRLGKIKYDNDPGFFSPENLSKITIDDVKKWLSIGDAEPPDPDIRAFLLRDLGVKLLKLYNGSVEELLDRSNNLIHGTINEPGLVDNLRVFRAYEDPVEKKPLLFAKFIIARGLFSPRDRLDPIIDNHLSRIAYRIGLVMVSGNLWNKIRRGVEVDREEDILLRLNIRRAYRIVALKSGIDPGVIDDYLWIMGRKICLRDKPPLCDQCLFKQICMARKNSNFMVKEHIYYNTWYY